MKSVVKHLGGVMLMALGLACGGARLQRFEFRERHMGTEARIVLHAPTAGQAERAAGAAFGRIAQLDSLLSDYRDDSELASLVARAGGPPVPVSEDLLVVLRRSLALAEETRGAFDVTVGPLVLLWREARRTGRLPDTAALRASAARVGWRHVALDTLGRTARLALAGMRLDLGGIAKGYAADQALDELRRHSVERALVAIGGEIVAGRAPPGEPGWRITVEHADSGPHEILLADAAVSSSGDTEQFVEISGVRYSHVVDPRTGIGLTHRTAATVVAPDGITADAFATAVTVLDGAQRAAFIAAHPEARFYVRSAADRAGCAGTLPCQDSLAPCPLTGLGWPCTVQP
ncbi:MAG: FAD:protein FMN transferase [Gemmatimonadetes bacterium]|nr:FAD:protein FMN transferase [Gemmatimonadota bacterium]